MVCVGDYSVRLISRVPTGRNLEPSGPAAVHENSNSFVDDQRDAQFFSMYLFLFVFLTVHVSITSCSSSGETNCVNTTSGNCHSVSVAVSCAGRK